MRNELHVELTQPMTTKRLGLRKARSARLQALPALVLLFVLTAPLISCTNDNFSLGAKTDVGSYTDTTPLDKADIVLIIDPTTSMAGERKKLASSLKNLAGQISATDWRLAVMTTSGTGELLEIENSTNENISEASCYFSKTEKGKYWVDASDASGIARVIATMKCGGARERVKTENGISSLYNSLINFKQTVATGASGLAKMLRTDSHWVFVALADSDEVISASVDSAGRSQTGTLPGMVTAFKATYRLPYKTFSFHSIIVPPDDEVCLKRVSSGSFGTGSQQYGTRYAELSKATQGVVGSICADDYAVVLASLAADVKKKVRATDLRCEPVRETLKIYFNEKLVSVPFTLEGTLLLLDPSAPRAGTYRFEYTCKVARI